VEVPGIRVRAYAGTAVNLQRTEVTVVQVHPDAASMEFHMGVVRERAANAYAETLDATTRGSTERPAPHVWLQAFP
jgi:hypothetical protein